MDGPFHGGNAVSPEAVVVGSLHLKTVAARVQVVVVHCLLAGIQGGPFIGEAHQAAGIAVVLGVQVAVGREAYGHVGLPPVERKGLAGADVVLRSHGSVVHPHIGEEYHALVRVGADIPGTEKDEAVGTSEHHIPA